jgi:transcriptional regulator NrdR family protein
MKCPSCQNIHCPKKVIRTWTVKNGLTKRKRRCLHCKAKFVTVEKVMVEMEMTNDQVSPGRNVI